MRRAVFLDRDGTLIEDKDYLHQVEEVVIIPGTVQALKDLHEAGFLLFMVTNQSGVGRGYFPMSDVENVHRFLEAEFAKEGVCFAHIYVAPEAPDQPSHGRKPSPNFLFDARNEFGIDLAESFMVGDKLVDLECGWNAGVKRSLLVRTGYGDKVAKKQAAEIERAAVVQDVAAAAAWILKDSKK